MKYKVCGYQFIDYEKDGKRNTGYRFHLISEPVNDGKNVGSSVDQVYISSSKQALIEKFLSFFKTGKMFRIFYNKYGSVEEILD